MLKKQCLIGLFLLSITASTFAGQGMFIRIRSYVPNIGVTVGKPECIDGYQNIGINKTAYIEGSCLFEKKRLNLNIMNNNQIIKQYAIELSMMNDGSSITSEGVYFIGDKVIAATLYPHQGVSGTQDWLAISIAPQEDAWMKNMGQQIGSKSLSSISMPGTHDTGTYGISKPEIAPDLDKTVQNLLRNDPMKEQHLQYAKDWAVTENLDMLNQLKVGIRYFDLRLCKTSQDELKTCHGLYAASMKSIIDDVVQFIHVPNHEKEIIILDFAPLNINSGDIAKLSQWLVNAFGSKIASPTQFNVNSLINTFWQQQRQIIVMLNNDTEASRYPDLFWPGSRSYGLWANTENSDELITKMINSLNGRDHTKLFNFSLVLTPQPQTVILGLLGGSINSLIKMTGGYKFKINDWLDQPQNKEQVRTHGNIISEDFSNGIDLTELTKELNSSTRLTAS